MKRSIARAPSVLFALLALSGWACAQGDGGSQTRCSLQYSTCKQTANADYQFCKNASEPNCRSLLNREMRSCQTARTRCQNTPAGRQFSQ